MARTLYLHLGPAKTGTSAVQHILSRHDGSIVLYPRVGLWPDGSHHNLVLNFFGDYQRPDLIRQDPRQLLAQIGVEARASDRDIVISSEILAGRRNLGEFATGLEAAIGEKCRVVLVVVAREHRERAASLYNQRVKDAVTGETRDPDAFLIDHPERLCYTNLLRRLRKTGFELRVLDYHPAADFVVRCLTLFGFGENAIPTVPRRNVSLGRLALVATLAANRAAKSHEERAQFDAILRHIVHRFEPAGFLFSKNAVLQVREMLMADRKVLRQEFGVKLPKPVRKEQSNPFVISEVEFAELAAAMHGLDDFGARVCAELRPMVRALSQNDLHPVEIEG
ncbi:MAG TPA: hypothetical protein VHU23_11550 [Rhizomicrobium sp.]|nr:hypothetical protein [Rhizomicrobium sp.]